MTAPHDGGAPFRKDVTAMAAQHNQVAWFEIGTDRPEQAERFYADVFGWTFADDPDAGMPYRLISTAPASAPSGGIFPTGGSGGSGGSVPGYAIFVVGVADVAATCRAVEEAGGKVLTASDQDAAVSYAHLLDPAGNRFGVFSPPAG